MTTPTNRADLRRVAEELRALLARATPGPWDLHSGYLIRAVLGDEATPIAEMRTPYRHRVGMVRGHYESEANAALVVAAVNALPVLLAEIEALRAEAVAARAEGYAEAQEQAARVAYDYDGDSLFGHGYDAQLGDARQTQREIVDAIRAMEPEGLQPTTKGDGT